MHVMTPNPTLRLDCGCDEQVDAREVLSRVAAVVGMVQADLGQLLDPAGQPGRQHRARQVHDAVRIAHMLLANAVELLDDLEGPLHDDSGPF